MAKKSAWGKKFLNSPVGHFLIPMLVSSAMRFIYYTARVEKIYPEVSRPYLDGTQPAIFCFWHGRMILHPFVKPRGRKMFVLISHHTDGAITNGTMRWFGIDSVRIARKKGANGALMNLFKVTREKDNICITPDGPRGPFQQAAPGAAYVAVKTGYPIVPITFSATRARRFEKSWDKFMLPKPFARVRFVAGTPIHVATEEDAAQATATLTADLTRITAEADRACGVAA